MKVSAPLLSPLLRSDTQGRLLADLYLNPEREFTATELAGRADTSVPSASRELSRMVSAGFLTARTSGRNRYVRVNRDHPLFAPTEQMLRYAYGPLAILPSLLRDVRGVREAYIYGSWAARLAGEPGPDPQDIDVLVVGDGVDRRVLGDVAEAARSRLHRDVNIRAVGTSAWAQLEDPFLAHIHSRPRAPIDLGHDEV